MKRILETIFVNMDNVCSITQENVTDIAYTKKQANENKQEISKISNRLWFIIVLIASTLGTSGANLLIGLMK